MLGSAYAVTHMRMIWSWELSPRGVMKLVGPLIDRIGAYWERAIWCNLKRLLEREDA